MGKSRGALTDRVDANVVGRHGSGEGGVPGDNHCELFFMVNDPTQRAVALLQNTALGGDNGAYGLAATSGPCIRSREAQRAACRSAAGRRSRQPLAAASAESEGP